MKWLEFAVMYASPMVYSIGTIAFISLSIGLDQLVQLHEHQLSVVLSLTSELIWICCVILSLFWVGQTPSTTSWNGIGRMMALRIANLFLFLLAIISNNKAWSKSYFLCVEQLVALLYFPVAIGRLWYLTKHQLLSHEQNRQHLLRNNVEVQINVVQNPPNVQLTEQKNHKNEVIAAAMDRLPSVMRFDNFPFDDVCCICLQAMIDKKNIVSHEDCVIVWTPCAHYFHRPCLEMWFCLKSEHNTLVADDILAQLECPMCRRSVFR